MGLYSHKHKTEVFILFIPSFVFGLKYWSEIAFLVSQYTIHWSLYNPAPFVPRKICRIKEGAGLKNRIYCCNVHEEDILATENCAGLPRVLIYKVPD